MLPLDASLTCLHTSPAEPSQADEVTLGNQSKSKGKGKAARGWVGARAVGMGPDTAENVAA